MWNFSERPVQIRTLIIVVSVVLVAAGLGLVAYSKFSSSKNAAITPVPLTPLSSDTNFVPVNSISTFIKPCLFVFLDSCATTVESTVAADPNPSSDPMLNTGDEAKARNDIFAVVSKSPNKNLATYEVPIDPSLIAEYFPEYEKDASSAALVVPAPTVIARVGAKFDINVRVLLVLMEVLHSGAGPLNSLSSDFTTPFTQSNPGFLPQLITIATDLKNNRTKYILMQQDKQLITSAPYYDKTYGVTANTNPETLAITDVLAKNLASKKDFEEAIYLAPANAPAALANQNFDLLYKLLYTVDPK